MLTIVGLAGVIAGLTAGPEQGWSTPGGSGIPLIGGLLFLGAFVGVEQRSPHPLVPLAIFKAKQFSAANLVTFVVYAALAGAFFLLPIQLQTVVDFSPIASGAALLPVTMIMLFGSARAGRLATRIGPRIPMSLGPVIAGVGLVLMTRIGAGSTYWVDVFPAVVVFGCGLSLTVAPLTATVLGAAPEQFAGVASAVNNDVARTAGLIAVAVLPPLAGISNADFGNADRLLGRVPQRDGDRGRDPHPRWAARVGHDPPPTPRARRRGNADPDVALRARRAPAAPRRRRDRLRPPPRVSPPVRNGSVKGNRNGASGQGQR